MVAADVASLRPLVLAALLGAAVWFATLWWPCRSSLRSCRGGGCGCFYHSQVHARAEFVVKPLNGFGKYMLANPWKRRVRSSRIIGPSTTGRGRGDETYRRSVPRGGHVSGDTGCHGYKFVVQRRQQTRSVLIPSWREATVKYICAQVETANCSPTPAHYRATTVANR